MASIEIRGGMLMVSEIAFTSSALVITSVPGVSFGDVPVELHTHIDASRKCASVSLK